MSRCKLELDSVTHGTINTSANRQRAVKAPSSKGKDKALSRLKCTVQVRRESFGVLAAVSPKNIPSYVPDGRRKEP